MWTRTVIWMWPAGKEAWPQLATEIWDATLAHVVVASFMTQ